MLNICHQVSGKYEMSHFERHFIAIRFILPVSQFGLQSYYDYRSTHTYSIRHKTKKRLFSLKNTHSHTCSCSYAPNERSSNKTNGAAKSALQCVQETFNTTVLYALNMF